MSRLGRGKGQAKSGDLASRHASLQRVPAMVEGNVAKVVPFPLACRRAFVDRHARLIAAMSPGAGERYLDRQLRIQFENLKRRGIDPLIIDREVTAFDAAIRAALWRAAFMPGQR
jgi:hypothetical protein